MGRNKLDLTFISILHIFVGIVVFTFGIHIMKVDILYFYTFLKCIHFITDEMFAFILFSFLCNDIIA